MHFDVYCIFSNWKKIVQEAKTTMKEVIYFIFKNN